MAEAADAPLISIVICCYNRAALLPQTLESVFAQTYRPVEIVVLDDGSTDGTRQLMAGYGDRIRYQFQENQGVAVARTHAAQLARGELIAFQDDDDLMAPARLHVLQAALAKHPECSFAVGDLAVVGTDDTLQQLLATHRDTGVPQRGLTPLWDTSDEPELTIYRDGYEAVLWPHVPATNHTTLFRRADGERINWFDTRYNDGAEDKDFFARLGRLGPVVHAKTIVSYYRRGHSSLTMHRYRGHYLALRLFQNHLESLPADQHVMRRRLEQRIRIALEAMITMKRSRAELPSNIPAGYVRDALTFLSFSDRLHYYTIAYLRAPLVAVLKRLFRARDPSAM